MNVGLIVVIVIMALLGLAIVAMFLGVAPGSKGLNTRTATKAQMARIVAAQRQDAAAMRTATPARGVYETTQEAKAEKLSSSHLTLEKKLRYAQWKIPPLMFRVGEVVISLVMCYLVSLKFNRVLTGMSLLSGPLFMRWLLDTFMNRRFKAFDADYPAFLLSIVSLLKTGLNPVQALEAGATELEPGSLVKAEVVLMLDRLRYGVPEDKSIGAFGEDIDHPEIELFVQALLLSRRVGGNLSDTLDRLAKQVRKRQFFRESAVSAVGMQRGSIWFILGIMGGMEVYLYVVYPQVVMDSLTDSMGWEVWQFGFVIILLGIYWIRQVTKIRT